MRVNKNWFDQQETGLTHPFSQMSGGSKNLEAARRVSLLPLPDLSRKIEGDSARRVVPGGGDPWEVAMATPLYFHFAHICSLPALLPIGNYCLSTS